MAIDLPPAVADDWHHVGGRTDDRSLSLATITAETAVFRHRPTADALERLRADGSVPARSLFTVDLAISPSLSAIGLDPGDALELAAPKARDGVVETLADDGIEVGAERANEYIDRPDGAIGHLTVLEAAYPIDATAATDGGTPDDDSVTIDAEVHAAVWPDGESYTLAGGLLPLEAPESDLLAAALDVDPARDREAIVDLFRGLDLEASDGD
ncbi:hypothetical protein NP511_13035 [Natrinema thermotolerans]|uniref:Uncharacterized protein n=1 Tax=Natrinema thermotolerans TaxID=121872 RepID=A0AAF0P889_9EURY|nr:hypothetical protein [Natrinema thermotolerans]QCC59339.1 hypothetical protein DVR14_12170 [Natrinema thermotolerans]WMT06310.1 hypothetical protein NP511_13035 [Natrinema thermotolerans]